MDYLKQLGFDSMELLLINGTRTSRLVFILSNLAALSLSSIMFLTMNDPVTTVIGTLLSLYVLFVTFDKRGKDLGHEHYISKAVVGMIFILTFYDLGDYTNILFALTIAIYYLMLMLQKGNMNVNIHGESPLKDNQNLNRLKINSFLILLIVVVLRFLITG